MPSRSGAVARPSKESDTESFFGTSRRVTDAGAPVSRRSTVALARSDSGSAGSMVTLPRTAAGGVGCPANRPAATSASRWPLAVPWEGSVIVRSAEPDISDTGAGRGEGPRVDRREDDVGAAADAGSQGRGALLDVDLAAPDRGVGVEVELRDRPVRVGVQGGLLGEGARRPHRLDALRRRVLAVDLRRRGPPRRASAQPSRRGRRRGRRSRRSGRTCDRSSTAGRCAR